jgi:hypothetical protein
MYNDMVRLVLALSVLSAAVHTGAEETGKIQDNSFLIEEAYNQEPGVVQHSQSFQYMKGDTWAYSFTQEWPAPTQKHQLSYTIPCLRVGDDEPHTGLGDVLLHYRYQAVLRGPLAFSPRLSLVTPTGDYRRGLGDGAWGLQGNLPLSLELGDRWVTHWNLGATFIPHAKGPDGSEADTTGFNYGASIIYLVDSHFNLMLELAGYADEAVGESSSIEREHAFFINPGARWAIDFVSRLQIVPGLSFPIGVGPSAGQYGVLFYLSLEHPF